MTWPPPPAPPGAQTAWYGGTHAGWAPPGGEGGAYDGEGDQTYDDADGDYEEEAEEEAYDAAASFVPGEVVWRVGDALDDDEEEDEAPEIELELTEEWAARFAQTEHRRAQRACAAAPQRCPTLRLPAPGAVTMTHAYHMPMRLAGKLQERAANRQGQAPEPRRSSAAGTLAPGAVAGPPLTVVDIVRAAGAGTLQPNEGAHHVAFMGVVRVAMRACTLVLTPPPPACVLARVELYGVANDARIAALEAAVQARYAKALSGGKANVWPCEPLRHA